MEFLLYILTDLFLTALFYLLIPVIIILCYRSKRLSQNKIKRIAIINGLCVWFIIMVIRIESGDESTNYSIFLWSWISYLLMKHFCLEDTHASTQSTPNALTKNEQRAITEQVLRDQDNVPKDNVEKVDDIQPYTTVRDNAATPSTSRGASVATKRSSWMVVASIVFAILFIVSLIVNIALYLSNSSLKNDNIILTSENTALEARIADLEDDNKKYNEYIVDISNKLDFFDEHIVFIEDDGTNLYHKYECSRFSGNSYWAHNSEYAEYRGYKPCPRCFD